MTAARARERIDAERKLHGKTPTRRGSKNRAVIRMYETKEMSIRNILGVKTIVANHFKVLIGDMNNETLNEIEDG